MGLGSGYAWAIMAEQAGLIGRGIRVKGEVTGAGALEVDGEIEGRVELDQLTVGPSGVVQAEVSVADAVVHGRTGGQLTASRRLEVKGSATVEGDVRAGALVIEEGAVFKGRVHMDTGIPEDV